MSIVSDLLTILPVEITGNLTIRSKARGTVPPPKPPPDGPPVPQPPPAPQPPVQLYDMNVHGFLEEGHDRTTTPDDTPEEVLFGSLLDSEMTYGAEIGLTRGNCAIEWEGAIEAPETGDVAFELQIKSCGRVVIDGKVFYDRSHESDPGGHSFDTVSFIVHMEKGRVYPCDFLLIEEGMEHRFELKWKLPSMTELAIMPMFYCHPPVGWQTRLKALPAPDPTPAPGPAPNFGAMDAVTVWEAFEPLPKPVFADSTDWRRKIDTDPVDPRSSLIIAGLGNIRCHPIYGPGVGIVFERPPADTVPTTIKWTWPTESNNVKFPVPPHPLVEPGSDRHWIAEWNGILWEIGMLRWVTDHWEADCGAMFALPSLERMTIGMIDPVKGSTSADAAGEPILPGCATYDEIASGDIGHAIRISLPRTGREFCGSAMHQASTLVGDQYAPMGARFRLKADVDLSGLTPEQQTFGRGFKTYGTVVADTGGPFMGVCGMPDHRYTPAMIDGLRDCLRFYSNQWEVVALGETTKVPR